MEINTDTLGPFDENASASMEIMALMANAAAKGKCFLFREEKY